MSRKTILRVVETPATFGFEATAARLPSNPPPQTPPVVRAYQACELLVKTHGVGFVDSTCWWGRCGGNATMGYIKNNASRLGDTLCTKSH